MKKCLTLILLIISSLNFGKEITPSHVYQVSENVIQELKLLNDANFTEVDFIKIQSSKRRPRHVYEKVREVLIKVQTLKSLKGLDPSEIPPFPTKEVKPENVKNLMDQILKDIQNLRHIYGVTDEILQANFKQGKTPTDVYMNITLIDAMVQGLDLPPVLPNDVYRVVLTIIDDINEIRNKLGITKNINLPKPLEDVMTSEVYEKAYSFLIEIKKITENNPEFNIPGGVVLVSRKISNIKPSDVMDILNIALAELGALKHKLGIQIPTQLAPPQEGKTPTDIYNGITKAILLLKGINQ